MAQVGAGDTQGAELVVFHRFSGKDISDVVQGDQPWLWGAGAGGLSCPAPPQAVVLEGNYWKRRIEVVMREYHKWRIYYKKRVSGSDPVAPRPMAVPVVGRDISMPNVQPWLHVSGSCQRRRVPPWCLHGELSGDPIPSCPWCCGVLQQPDLG